MVWKKNNKKIKLFIIVITVLLIIGFSVFLYQGHMKKKQLEIEKKVRLNRNIEVEIYGYKKISEVFKYENIDIYYEDKINTTKLGKQNINIKYKYDNKKYKSKVVVNVVDTTPPTIFAKSSYKVYKGSNYDFINRILCGDNYDDIPIRKIIGDYDLNKVGNYKVSYYAKDSSGNESTKDFTIKVVEKPKSGSGSGTTGKQKLNKFTDIYKKYKKDNNHIGIDVSKYQGNVDFNKVKDNGCEFVIIRLGYQKGINGKLVLDNYFKSNIEKASKAGLKIGVYIYTYAKDKNDAVNQAKWVIKNVGDYKLDLGISYDWESWDYFNYLNLSYYNFNKVADSFLSYVKAKGYYAFLYSSKYYLENIWLESKYKVWLAHYTDSTNYKGKYSMWQIMSTGSIDGIDGAVDIDIFYD